MNNILREILTSDNNISKYCLKYLNGIENELLNILGSMNSFCLYDSPIHGRNHSERVLLFSFLLGKYYNLNEKEFSILMDAAWYHDIGRESDCDDPFHGYSSALKLNKVINLSKYTKKEVNMLKAVIDAHSRSDSKMEDVIFDYDIEENDSEVFYRLSKMLKDADALDRLRFSDYCDACLNSDYLRYSYSKELVEFALNINNIYKYIYRSNYEINFLNGGYCFHSVGFDFFKFDSILKNGILSVDEMKKRNIDICKNFDGGNQDLWISVIDCDLVFDFDRKKQLKNSTSGYLEFINRGISFLSETNNFVDACNKKDKDMALLLGIPYNQGNYYDERYVYKKIPRTNILSVEIPVNYLNARLRDLNYVYNRLSISQINKKLLYFENKFKKNGIIIDSDKKEKLLFEYDKILKETKDLKKLPDRLFEINGEINKLIQEGMQEYFNIELGILDGDVTVYQVVSYLLNKNGLNNNFINESFFDTDITNNECVSCDIIKKYNVVRSPKIKCKR